MELRPRERTANRTQRQQRSMTRPSALYFSNDLDNTGHSYTHTHTHPFNSPSCRPTNSVKALKAQHRPQLHGQNHIHTEVGWEWWPHENRSNAKSICHAHMTQLKNSSTQPVDASAKTADSMARQSSPRSQLGRTPKELKPDIWPTMSPPALDGWVWPCTDQRWPGNCLSSSTELSWVEMTVLPQHTLLLLLHTYIQIYIAPKIVKTNLRRRNYYDYTGLTTSFPELPG